MTLRERVRAGGPVAGAMVFEFFTPGMPRLLSLAGAEFAIYDMEHGAAGLETLKTLAAASAGLPAVPMARVPRGERVWISRALDVGMKGIMVPMVESAEAAAEAVEALRYPPEGRRGAAFGFAHDGYAPGAPAGKMRAANADNLLILQIESERGLAALDAIAATPGVDALWLGHFDLSAFLGVPGDFEAPAYREAVDALVAAAKRNGLGLGVMAADAAWAAAHRALGFNMIAVGTDQGLFLNAAGALLREVRGE